MIQYRTRLLPPSRRSVTRLSILPIDWGGDRRRWPCRSATVVARADIVRRVPPARLARLTTAAPPRHRCRVGALRAATEAEKASFDTQRDVTAKWRAECRTGTLAAEVDGGFIGVMRQDPDQDGDVSLRLADLSQSGWVNVGSLREPTGAETATFEKELQETREKMAWCQKDMCVVDGTTGQTGVVQSKPNDDGKVQLQWADLDISGWLQCGPVWGMPAVLRLAVTFRFFTSRCVASAHRTIHTVARTCRLLPHCRPHLLLERLSSPFAAGNCVHLRGKRMSSTG